MESVKRSDSENQARAAREEALNYRPSEAPLPASIIWPVDNEPYRLAALQYFEAAKEYYQNGEHGRGDLCILRGDRYLLLASFATQVNSVGVAPLLEKKPAEPPDGFERFTREELEEKRDELHAILKQGPRTVPEVPAEAANADTCDYFHEQSLGAVYQAILASEAGNDAGVDHWMHESLLYDIAYDMCEEKIHKYDS
jgi:hypothetical protein